MNYEIYWYNVNHLNAPRFTLIGYNTATAQSRKPTNIGLCLNGDSECPVKLKSSVIAAYTKRAVSHCSSWNDVHKELDFMAHQRVDNGYSNKDVRHITRGSLNQWYAPEERGEEKRKENCFTGTTCMRNTRKMRPLSAASLMKM